MMTQLLMFVEGLERSEKDSIADDDSIVDVCGGL